MTDSSPDRIDSLRARLFESPIATLGFSRTKPAPFVALLDQAAPQIGTEVKNAFASLEQTVKFAQVPIIGICGLMNSGKSTTTALHLSPSGRARVNIGDTSSEGTHRFVLWMPEQRRSQRDLLVKVLGSAFPEKPEDLSDDPSIAAEQYNARRARLREFQTPLIAFDSGLDQHGIGLLDCPDIQRAHDLARREETAEIRRDALRAAARLCSAFYVVSSVEQQENADLDVVMQTLGGSGIHVPLYYVLTKVDGAVDTYVAEAEKRLGELRVREKVRGIFVSPRIRNRPNGGFPEGLVIHHGKDPGRGLDSVVRTLDAGALQTKFVEARVLDLKKQCRSGLAELERHFQRNDETSNIARADLLAFLAKQFLDADSGIRSLLSFMLLAEMKESIQRTTPWYFRMGTAGAKLGKWIRNSVADVFRDAGVKKETVDRTLDDLPQTHALDFRKFVQGRRWLPASVTDQELELVWERVMVHHKQNSALRGMSAKDREELDRVTAKMWEDVPMDRKAMAIALVPIAVLGALVTAVAIPVDMGATTVLYSASVAELFAVLGVGGVVSVLSGRQMQRYLEKKVGRPQLAELLALLQDACGMRRANERELAAMRNNEVLGIGSSDISPMDAICLVLEEPFGTLTPGHGLSEELDGFTLGRP